MRSTGLRAILVATGSRPGDAMGAHPRIKRVPQPITPAREMDALARFHRDVTWTGTIAENGMGPGTP